MTTAPGAAQRRGEGLPRPAQRIHIHDADCWRFPHHHACAVKRIQELEAQVTRLERLSESQSQALDMMERGHL